MRPASPVPVAVFVSSFESGGTERQTTELIRRLDPRRFEVHGVCLQRSGACLAAAEERAASILEFPTSGFRRPGTWKQAVAFARWCRAKRIAIVHTCDFYANVFGLPAAALAGVPVRIGSRRELNPDKSFAKIALQRASYTAAHRIVANSQAAAERLAFERVAPSKIRVIPNGIAMDRFSRPRSVGQSPRVVTVGNLRREKAHEVLIEAAVSLVSKHPGIEFVVVGDGPRRDELTELTRQRGVEKSFRFLWHREDIPELLATADLFVLPSRSEAFPNAVVEAMAAGLPVVASAVGGLLELVDDEKTGLLVRPDDVPAFTRAIDRLLVDKEAAADLGLAARASVQARLSFERMVAAFEELYMSELVLRSGAPERVENGNAPAVRI